MVNISLIYQSSHELGKMRVDYKLKFVIQVFRTIDF